MAIRWTEEEALSHGYRRNARGEWEVPRVHNRDSLPVPELEPSAGEWAQETARDKKEAQSTGQASCRYRIRVTAFCRRHRDPDNLCVKWYVDELVRRGIIPDDSSRFVHSIEKSVVKVSSGHEEKTIIWVVRYDE